MKYFTINELIKSDTAKKLGIDNTPSEEQKKSLTALVENILDPLRERFGYPIVVSSGYRCDALNKAVKGSSTSQHRLGEAADIHTKLNNPQDNKKLFDLIVSLGLPFDQLIDEYGYKWIHVSYGPRNRRQILHLK